MAGGQGFTASAGSLGRTLTIALVGTAVACSQGSVSPNNEGIVPLVGSQTTLAQQTIAPSWEQALTGSESTSAAGTVSPSLVPTQITGQSITGAQGIVTPLGSSVTVNITGEEFTAAAGTLTGGTQFITGSESTSAAGTMTYGLALPITGIESACGQGAVSAAQEADDAFIASGIGNVAQSAEIPLVGSVATTAQGTLTITSDAESALTGSAITSEAGSLGYGEEFPLSGSEITSAQQSMGAPGGATLTGSVVTVSAGDVFTTNDRSFNLTGQSMTAQDGLAVTSYLAFVTGQELTVSAQEIGPRGAVLAGEAIISATGDILVPRADHRRAAAPDKPRRNYTYKGKRYHLTNDELARLIARDLIDITREDIEVTYKNKKSHKISKDAFEAVLNTASKLPKQDITDDQDIEDILALL